MKFSHCLVCCLPALPALSPAHGQSPIAGADGRKSWKGTQVVPAAKKGEMFLFKNTAGKTWRRVDGKGKVIFTFEETGRTAEYVEVIDRSRGGGTLRIQGGEVLFRKPDRGWLVVGRGAWEAKAAPAPAGGDKIVGAIWHVYVKPLGKRKYQAGPILRCTTDGKVYLDGRVVGSHTTVNIDNVVLRIRAIGPRMNGGITATRVTKNGSFWAGRLKNSIGRNVPVRLVLKKD